MAFQKCLGVNLTLSINPDADGNEDFFAAAINGHNSIKIATVIASTIGTLMDIFLAVSIIW